MFIGDVGKDMLPRYSGTSNPKAHKTSFRIAMDRSQLREDEKMAGYSQLFAKNLFGAALKWFSKQEEESIDSFKQLSAVFLKHYSMFVEDESTIANLWNTQQSEFKSLKDFMSRFKGIMAKILSIDNDYALTALKNGLWHDSRFHEEIVGN